MIDYDIACIQYTILALLPYYGNIPWGCVRKYWKKNTNTASKSDCVLNFNLPFLGLNVGNLDLPVQTLTVWNAALDVTKKQYQGSEPRRHACSWDHGNLAPRNNGFEQDPAASTNATVAGKWRTESQASSAEIYKQGGEKEIYSHSYLSHCGEMSKHFREKERKSLVFPKQRRCSQSKRLTI